MQILFVHGALVRDGAWWWAPTADLVEQRTGVASRALALPSCGEAPAAAGLDGLRADAAALRQELDLAAPDSVVLVAHSYGGTVVAEAGAHPAVRGLLLVSSYLPDTGLAQADIMGGEADPVRIRPRDDGRLEVEGYDEASFAARFLQDGTADQQREAWERVTPQEATAFVTPTTAEGWRGVDSTSVVCSDDRSTSVGLQREHASRATRVVEVPTGHHPFLTRPDLVAAEVERLLG